MSWLFGYKSQTNLPPPPEDPNAASGGQLSGDQNLTKAERKAMEAYRFDSSALERAADAAKVLEKSSK